MKDINFKVEISGIVNGSQDTSVGFYVDGTEKSFKWVLHGDVAGYKTGVLLDRWLSGLSSKVDIRRFGRFSSVGGGSLFLDSTSGLYTFLRSNNIALQGKNIVITEIDGLTETVIFNGVCTKSSYTPGTVKIQFDDLTKHRSAVIGERFEAEKYIPAVFGKMEKAKFVEYVNTQEILRDDNGSEVILQCRENYDPGLGGARKGETISVFADDSITIGGKSVVDHFSGAGNYYYIESFLGNGSGVIRRARVASNPGVTEGKRILYFTFDERVNVDEDGNLPFGEIDVVDVSDVTYFRLYTAEYTNIIDSWGYSDGLQGRNFFSIVDGVYLPIPDVVNNFTIDNNVVGLISKSFESFGTITGLLKCERNTDIGAGLFAPWGLNSVPSAADLDKYIPVNTVATAYNALYVVPPVDGVFLGIYYNYSHGAEPVNDLTLSGNISNMFDGDHATSFDFTWSCSDTSALRNQRSAIAFPVQYKAPQGGADSYRMLYDYDLILNGVHAGFNAEDDTGTQLIGTYRNIFTGDKFFKGRQQNLTGGVDTTGLYVARVNNFVGLDNFNSGIALTDDTSNGLLEKNGQYWRHDLGGDTSRPVGGFDHYFYPGHDVSDTEELTKVDVSNKPISKEEIIDVGLLFTTACAKAGGAGFFLPGEITLSIRALQLFAEVEVDFSEGIFTNWHGRKDTEGGDLLESPSDIYNHIVKLQNYSSQGESSPSGGWGLGFISDYTDYMGNVPEIAGEYAAQLFTKKELETSNIKNDLLRNMWAFGFVDNTGKEQVIDMSSVFDEDATGRIQVEYRDIVAGSMGDVSEANKDDIFCTPFVKYDYDVGLETYNKEIVVLNVEEAVFDSNYVSGDIDDSDKQIIWNMSRQLFLNYGVINDAPTQLTESKWIRTSADAVTYLKKWLQWQGASLLASDLFSERRSITFDLHYEFVKDNNIEIGALLDVEIPFLSNQPLIGVFTSLNYNLQKGRELVKCEAFIRLPKTALQIIESGNRDFDIIESGSRGTNISEVGGI